MQGGGWCNMISSCVYRKTTCHSSSKFMEKQLPFNGILSNKLEENPGFSNIEIFFLLLVISGYDFYFDMPCPFGDFLLYVCRFL